MKRRCSLHKAERNQGSTPRKFILSLIDLKLLKSLISATVCTLLLFFCQCMVALERYLTSFSNNVQSRNVALDFMSHIYKFKTFRKVK